MASSGANSWFLRTGLGSKYLTPLLPTPRLQSGSKERRSRRKCTSRNGWSISWWRGSRNGVSRKRNGGSCLRTAGSSACAPRMHPQSRVPGKSRCARPWVEGRVLARPGWAGAKEVPFAVTRRCRTERKTFHLLRIKTGEAIMLVLFVLLTGCGYEFGTGAKPGAAYGLRLAVPVFHNDSFE